jgi:hypothetical protein
MCLLFNLLNIIITHPFRWTGSRNSWSSTMIRDRLSHRATYLHLLFFYFMQIRSLIVLARHIIPQIVPICDGTLLNLLVLINLFLLDRQGCCCSERPLYYKDLALHWIRNILSHFCCYWRTKLQKKKKKTLLLRCWYKLSFQYGICSSPAPSNCTTGELLSSLFPVQHQQVQVL